MEEADHIFDLEIILHVGPSSFRKIDCLYINPVTVIAAVELVAVKRDHLRVPMILLSQFFRLVDGGPVNVGAARTVVMDSTNFDSIDFNLHIASRMCEAPHVKNQESRGIGVPGTAIERNLPLWVSIPNSNRTISHNKSEITEKRHFKGSFFRLILVFMKMNRTNDFVGVAQNATFVKSLSSYQLVSLFQ